MFRLHNSINELQLPSCPFRESVTLSVWQTNDTL